MSSFFTKNTDIELPSSEDIKHYQKLREVGIELKNQLVKQLPKTAMPECAKKLGMLKGKTLIVGCEDEVSVLFDYCLYHFRINKVNVISRYLLMSPPEKNSLEREFLEASEQAHYNIVMVKKAFKGKGILVADLLDDREFFMIDLNFSQTATQGLMFATNVVPIGRFYRSSGAIVPIPTSLFENEIASIIEKFFKTNETLSPAQEALFASQVIRAALRAEVMENVRYE